MRQLRVTVPVWTVTAILLVVGSIVGAIGVTQAQNPGLSGQPVYNQVTQLRAVTPSDTANLPQFTRAIFVGNTACNVAVLASGDQTGQQQTMTGAVGWLPVSVRRVLSTGTTCTNILVGY